MYALGRTPLGAGDGISCPRQADSVQWATAKATAQAAFKLPATRTVRHWLGDARSNRAPQGYAGLAG